MYDVIIIGGGIMGCSAAYHLMRSGNKVSVAVVEPDPSYSHASTTLSLANVRIQFSLKENIQISRYTLEVLERFEGDMEVDGCRPEINFRREGNLFLVNEEWVKQANQMLELQKNLGCSVEWWGPEKIIQNFPLYDASGFAGGTFGPRDGHLDAYSFLMGYKTKARSLGVRFITGEVVDIKRAKNRVSGVGLASGENLMSGFVINCAGGWAGRVARMAGVKLPIEPVKRQVFVLDTEVKPKAPLPLTILPTGLYFRTETGNLILLGKSMAEDPVGFNFTWDDKRFMEILWPEFAGFVPAFDRLKLVRGWAGLYAVNSLDGNAILGEWPELKGFFLANGFSGHGLQQAPAVGRYLAELIFSQAPTLDLSIFDPGRILDDRPLSESGLV